MARLELLLRQQDGLVQAMKARIEELTDEMDALLDMGDAA